MASPTFKLPDGVMVPDGVETGETFQAMATFLIKSGNKCQLVAIDNEPLEGAPKTGMDTNEAADNDTTDSAPPMSLQQRLMGGG